MTEYPPEIEKKVKLLNYFMNYMKEHLLKAGANMQSRDGDELSRIPFLRTWFRTSRAVVMFLTNGTVQVTEMFQILNISIILLWAGSCSDQGHAHSAGVRSTRPLCGPHTTLKAQKSPHPHSIRTSNVLFK